jgi:hypothetical protein
VFSNGKIMHHHTDRKVNWDSTQQLARFETTLYFRYGGGDRVAEEHHFAGDRVHLWMGSEGRNQPIAVSVGLTVSKPGTLISCGSPPSQREADDRRATPAPY